MTWRAALLLVVTQLSSMGEGRVQCDYDWSACNSAISPQQPQVHVRSTHQDMLILMALSAQLKALTVQHIRVILTHLTAILYRTTSIVTARISH